MNLTNVIPIGILTFLTLSVLLSGCQSVPQNPPIKVTLLPRLSDSATLKQQSANQQVFLPEETASHQGGSANEEIIWAERRNIEALVHYIAKYQSEKVMTAYVKKAKKERDQRCTHIESLYASVEKTPALINQVSQEFSTLCPAFVARLIDAAEKNKVAK